MERPSRDWVFLEEAKLHSLRSTCERGQVGAVIVKDNHVVSHGYNGAPPGQPHCTEVGCVPVRVELGIPGIMKSPGAEEMLRIFGCQRTVHAEANAIAWAARRSGGTEGATMYCTYSPCKACLLKMASAGIVAVVYEHPYRATPWDLIEDLGMEALRGR